MEIEIDGDGAISFSPYALSFRFGLNLIAFHSGTPGRAFVGNLRPQN